MTATGHRLLGPIALCVGLFSVVPLRARWVPRADRARAAAALRWLPVLGAVLGAVAGAAAVGLHRAGPLVGATVAIALLALATRGLHLDGLADLADGLGSRQTAAAARQIMRTGDVGPFGVATLVLTLLLDIACYAAILARTGRAEAVVVLVVVVAASRVTAVLVAGLPAARPDGFGALVAASQGLGWRGGGLLAGGAIGAAAGTVFGMRPAVVLAAAALIGPICGYLLACHAGRRLGGVSGDVFGAGIEIAAAAALLVGAAAL